ncbi:hypothetical protein DERP_000367 [Dermatophagoides pteronyssinus]|uniref:Uncharacterized protein n=1 Tax=Dermatophagoides pteronyssinus TaxID=6956 RepID=A0ABQ8IZZ4_DERPT|nr:hypothetical protein DERP_000367 [Dermatophagoides pteronyssinus]
MFKIIKWRQFLGRGYLKKIRNCNKILICLLWQSQLIGSNYHCIDPCHRLYKLYQLSLIV